MNRREWTACADPRAMLPFLQGKVSDRKLRLFACACCRRIIHLVEPHNRLMLDVAERYADGKAMDSELSSAAAALAAASAQAEGAAADDHLTSALYEAVTAVWQTLAIEAADAAWFVPICAAAAVADAANSDPSSAQWKACDQAESAAQADLLRDIVGNPLHPVEMSQLWLTPTAVAIANEIYEHRAFDRMHELSAALSEAGCADHELLAHCRSSGPHVRGCWAIDALSGRK